VTILRHRHPHRHPPSSPLECLVSQGFLHGGDDGDDGFVPLTSEMGNGSGSCWFPSHSWRGGESVNSSSPSSPHDVSPCQHRANEGDDGGGDDGFRGPSPPSPLSNCPATRIMRSRSLRGRVCPIRGKLLATVQFQQVVVRRDDGVAFVVLAPVPGDDAADGEESHCRVRGVG
jgi:hypothetical protein